MRIGYVVTDFSPLSEAFIRRDVLALCGAGHRVFVYTNRRHCDPHVEEPSHANLLVRLVSLSDSNALAQATLADGIEHLHGSLMSGAHRAAFIAARASQTPFTLMAYSGHDIFTRHDPTLYAAASSDPLCVAVIVEDSFMQDWMTEQLGVAADKIQIVPNSFDLDLYCLPKPRVPRDRIVILSVARFVEKKGLINLVKAFNQLLAKRDDVELWLVGFGPEDGKLRQAAGGNERIKFLGAMSEAQTRICYADADIFCLPCIRTARGDADGIPTTTLEAMAFELPVVSTNLLSTPCYVRDGQDGLLVPPNDVAALTEALERLCANPKLRHELGASGRVRVSELCDSKRNVTKLEEIFIAGRWANWHEKLRKLKEQRSGYTAERENYYTECRVRAVNYFQPGPGRLLEIGCGLGKLRFHLPAGVEYYGCDVLADTEVSDAFPFAAARAENLPFKENTFDAIVFYAVLIHVFDVDRALAEAARILKPGGRLYLQECYDDANPIHMNHFSGASLRARIEERFDVISAQPANEYLMMMVAKKPLAESDSAVTLEGDSDGAAGDLINTGEQIVRQSEVLPLVSICITTYNRSEFVRTCINSALRQTYPNVEVIVVDDGSTDDTRRVLESYGSALRVGYNERNRGVAFSKNRSLMMSSSEARYVGVLDSDDYYDPRFVERSVDCLERQPEVGLVYTDDIMVDAQGNRLWTQPAVEPWDIDTWLRTRNLRGDTWLARRKLVMQTRLHDAATEPDEDYDLFYQLLEITTFAHVREFLVFIRQHEGRTTTINQLALARAHAANLVKHGYSPEYAYLRARSNPEWIAAIEDGIALGRQLRQGAQGGCVVNAGLGQTLLGP